MTDNLKTWFWRVFKVFLVFMALYIFGDFRVNDVNVKDFLQSKVPPKTLFAAKDWVVERIVSAYEIFDESLKSSTNGDDGSQDEDEDAEEVLKRIQEREQNKMLELLKSNVDVEEKLKEGQSQVESLQKAVEEQDAADDTL